MNENKCNDCPQNKTLVSGWRCCMGNSCEVDVRNKTIDEFVNHLKQSLIYTSDENGWEGYTVEEKEIDEIAEQMKERKNESV